MFQRCFGCMQPLHDPDAPCTYCGYDKRAASFNRNHLEPGTMLRHRYVIGKPLGVGSFAITYIGWDTQEESIVTIREFLPSEFATHRVGSTYIQFFSDHSRALFLKGLRTFKSETMILRDLEDTESVNPVRDYVEENGTGYAVMSYLHGKTLKVLLAEYRVLSFEDAMGIMTPVLKTLHDVHKRGLLHRDICPDNIFVCDDGSIKILDFGSAQFELLQDSAGLPIILKHGYAPPEQYSTLLLAGPWTDVFGAAATLYKMITGLVPPDVTKRSNEDTLLRPSELECAIPPMAENALIRALSLPPENRYATAAAFYKALTADAPKEPEEEEPKKRKIWIPVLIAALAVVLGIVFAVVHSAKKPAPPKPETSVSETAPQMELPDTFEETYYDGFAPEEMSVLTNTNGEAVAVPYAVFTKNGQKGLVDMEGNVLLQAQYSSIQWDKGQLLLNGSQRRPISGQADYAPALPSTAAATADTEEEGPVIPSFDGSRYVYSEEKYTLYRVLKDGTQLEQIAPEGSFIAKIGSGYGLVTRGTVLVDGIYEKATPISCGISAFLKDGEWTYFSVYGTNVLNSSFSADLYADGIPYSFNEGYVPIYDSKDSRWGYANTAGEMAIDAYYLSALPPMQGKAWVKTEKGWGTIAFSTEDSLVRAACGEQTQYTYHPENGLLEITGYGSMWDFTEETVPWLSYKQQIRTVHMAGGVSYIGANAFRGCELLTSITISPDVSAIGPAAFSGCRQLRMATLPSTLQYIGDEAFAECGLVDLFLPDSLQTVGICAFRDCASLQTVTASCAALRVADYCFCGCSVLRMVEITNAELILGTSVFDGCSALQTATLPGHTSAIGANCFRGCVSLTSFNVPLDMKIIEPSTFKNCTAMETVTLPDGLTTVGESAFAGCISLQSVSFPPTTTAIGAHALEGCSALTGILVPTSVSRIDDYAFSGCVNVRTFDLTNSVNNLGAGVFNGWRSNQTIRLKNALLKKIFGTPLGWNAQWNSGCNASIVSG